MFWIFVSKGQATLHRDTCPDCNCGTGKDGSVDLSGKWKGPYELLEDVKANPPAAPLKPCRKCQPLRDW